jgi:hypothetical protein
MLCFDQRKKRGLINTSIGFDMQAKVHKRVNIVNGGSLSLFNKFSQ